MFVRTLSGHLAPAEERAAEWTAKMRAGEMITIQPPKRARNGKHHRLFFALMTLVYQNLPEDSAALYRNVDQFVSAVKIAAGHYDELTTPGGTVHKIPKSISFARMDQTAFDQFYDSVCELIINHFLPGVTSEDLKREVGQMVGTRFAA